MEEKIMTTKELASYIKLSEKTIIKMAQNGKLPGVKISNKWRFTLSSINEYLEKEIVAMPDDDLNIIIKTAENILPLSRLISSDLIDLDNKATNKIDLLKDVSLIAEKAGLLSDAVAFANLLIKREEMLSTALGQGVAIPHPRDPQIGMFNSPRIMMIRSKNGIDFEAPDAQKTYLFFVVCATNEFVHLRLLAKISKFLHIPNIVEKLINLETKDEFMQLLLEFEREQILPLQ